MSEVPIKKFSTTKKRVYGLLKNLPELRDDLEKLITTIWYNDLKNQEQDPETMTAKHFLIIYRHGKLTPAETIRRTWQQIQEKHPDLRGANWMERHNISDEVKATIKR